MIRNRQGDRRKRVWADETHVIADRSIGSITAAVDYTHLGYVVLAKVMRGEEIPQTSGLLALEIERRRHAAGRRARTG